MEADVMALLPTPLESVRSVRWGFNKGVRRTGLIGLRDAATVVTEWTRRLMSLLRSTIQKRLDELARAGELRKFFKHFHQTHDLERRGWTLPEIQHEFVCTLLGRLQLSATTIRGSDEYILKSVKNFKSDFLDKLRREGHIEQRTVHYGHMAEIPQILEDQDETKLVSNDDHAEEKAHVFELDEQFDSRLEKLNQQQRRVYELCFIEGRTNRSAAQIMGLHESMVSKLFKQVMLVVFQTTHSRGRR